MTEVRMRIRPCVLFDFDGTLFDTAPGIMHCMRDALASCGYDPGGEESLRRFVGPPVLDALREFYGMDGAESERVKQVYRAAYRSRGVYECAPMPGAEACLRDLRAAGVRLAVATSKPQFFAEEIARRFRFDGYFEAVCGALEDARSAKTEIVARALRELDVSPADAVMVGDRKYDVYGAAANGVPCIGIRAGCTPEGELEEAGAVAVADDFAALRALLLGERPLPQ